MRIFLYIFLALSVYGFFKEPKITGYYKAVKVYGRIYAYIAVAFATSAISAPLVILENIKTSNLIGVSIPIIPQIITMIFSLAGAIYMYYRVYQKTPDFMKKRCLIDLTISGLGTAFRVFLFVLSFFISTWWTVSMPDMYTLDGGQSVYVFPDGYVYDPSKNRFGQTNEDKTTVTWN